jgi:Ras-related protein Rab-1A
LIVYDVSDKKSFGHIKDWLEEINKFTDNNPIKLIVGNKCDLVNEKQVTEEDKKLLKKQTGIDIIETSAKNSFKITEAMEMITKKLIERNGQGGNNTTEIGNQKEGISLDKTNLQNNNGDNCCSFSL